MNFTMSLKSIASKAALAAVALGGFMMFSGATAVQARDRDDFDRRPVVRYNYDRHEGFERGYYYSPRAEYWRHERHERFEHGWRDRDGYWHRDRY